ncbi:putative oxidoreductase, aryl-alcohol dehydrogenase like protein [Methanolobus tindarius DSM 2278]|uniref:Putative oxidoreductase, aryl-alcohol dehydrogenase like protein n=1 Tax=Methanolobus tindarius DSM 2278 TaxID=1090322 RepID=W9DQ86_METTI|nr:aldo/keto reductase [Methanolobus tindarius]ETA67460.1 putative oxidoreductase, aryl-alcohol dehydrogenase like protein [Methanolobus tindarius DSM 2278]
MLSKLTLGTAQLGLNYGINNKLGKPQKEQALSILEYAYSNGITSFDTASAYGDSEVIIGEFIANKDRSKCYITSKLEPLFKNKVEDTNLEEEIFKKIEISLSNLKSEYIDNYLIHDFKDINHYTELVPILTKAKEKGLIRNIGVSVYAPYEAETILTMREFDVIQIPLNILDHRFLKNSLLKRLKENGFTIFTRSAFLQGLLFMDANKIPANLLSAKANLIEINRFVRSNNISISQLALNFAMSIEEIDSIIIGVDSEEQLTQNIQDFNIAGCLDIDASIFESEDEIIIDPRKW